MDWRYLISDFSRLAKVVVERLGKHGAARNVERDRATIQRWLDGGGPKEESDVATLIRTALAIDEPIENFQTFRPIYDLSGMLTYEQKLQNGPPKLLWLADPGVPLPSYPVKIGHLDTDCPLGIASSPLVSDDSWISLMLNLGFGFATMKTRRLRKQKAWDPPHIAFVEEVPDLLHYNAQRPPEVPVSFDIPQTRVTNIVNSMRVPSEDAGDWQGIYERVKHHRKANSVGLSVMGEGATEHDLKREINEVISKAADLKPPYIEFNASCPNLGKKGDLYDDVSLLREILKEARKTIKGRASLFVKIPSLPTTKMKDLIQQVGTEVEGVVFRNTIRVRPIRRTEEGKFPAFIGRDFGGLSGPCMFPSTLSGTRELDSLRRDLKMSFAIIAVGGVSNVDETMELMKAGADAVQACTAPIFDPFLGLKVRYGLTRVSKTLRSSKNSMHSGIHLILPRTGVETESFAELEAAVSEITRRDPRQRPSFERVAAVWNTWQQSRSSVLPGDSRRMPGSRKRANWVEDLLK